MHVRASEVVINQPFMTKVSSHSHSAYSAGGARLTVIDLKTASASATARRFAPYQTRYKAELLDAVNGRQDRTPKSAKISRSSAIRPSVME